MILYQVKSDYFCAGLVVRECKVIKAAPIISYMLNKDISWIKDYINNKNWTLSRVEDS